MQALSTKTPTKGMGKMKVFPKSTTKSLMELSQEIPDGKYEGLLKTLEPHELPKRWRKVIFEEGVAFCG